MNQEQGLNGFRAWFKRNANIIAGICALVGLAPLGAAIKTLSIAMDEDSPTSKQSNYEPSASESIILDAWVNNKLTPFYQNLLIQIKSAFESTNYSFQLQQINDVEMKMCVVRSYYLTHETANLSLNAINLRSEFIDTILSPVEQMISNSMTNSEIESVGYSFTVNDPKIFSPLNIQNITVECEKYINKNGANGNSQSLLTPNPVIVNPLTNQVVPTNPNSANPKADSKFLLMLLGLLGVVVLFYPENDDKKTKK